MKKFLAIFLLLQLSLITVFAGDFEDAYSTGSNVLVYFYSPSCISCKSFNSVFNEIASEHKDIKCVKVNIDEKKGQALFRKYHGLYVPYLILISKNTKKTVSISTSCAINDMCIARVFKNIKS